MAIQPPLPDAMTSQPTHVNAEAGPSRLPAYRLAQSLSGHRRSVTALQWTSDGRTLISAGADGLLNFWSSPSLSASLSHSRTLRAHRSGINDLSISPDDLYVATAADDNAIHIFPVSPSPSAASSSPNPSTSSSRLAPPLRSLQGHTAPVLALAFSPKSNLLVSGSFDESAIVWDVRRGAALRQLPAHSEAVWTVGWDGEGVMVLTGSADGLIRLWDATTGQCLKTLDNDSNAPFTSARFTPNPFYLVAGTPGTVRVYNIHTGKVVKTLRTGPGPEGAEGEAGSLTNGGDGAAGSNAAEVGDGGGLGMVLVITAALPTRALPNAAVPNDSMDVDSGDTAATGPGHGSGPGPGAGNGSLAAQARAPAQAAKQGAWVFATGDTGKITIWDLSSRRIAQVLDKHVSPAVALAVSPDGRMVATGSLEPEKVVHVWRDDE